jgi:hypothetical protein
MLNGLENVYLPKPNGNLPEEGERVVYIHGEAYLSQKESFKPTYIKENSQLIMGIQLKTVI